MSNASPGIRYPKALLNLPKDEYFTDKQIAAKLNVSDRTVYRWYTQGYLQRKVEDKLTTYTLNGRVSPKVVIKTRKAVTKKYTNEQLEDFYQQIMEGKLKLQTADISKFIHDEADAETLEGILKGLEDYIELVSYILMNKR